MITIFREQQKTVINCELCEKSFETDTPILSRGPTWYKAITNLSKLEWKMKLSKDGLAWETYCEKDKIYS